MLGLSEATHRRAKKTVEAKRATLEGSHTPQKPVYFSQVVKAKQLDHDLIKNVPECTSSTAGKPLLLNDTNLTANMPPM